MNWKIHYTGEARQDLRDILDYISNQLHEPATAVRLVRQITDEINGLNVMPERYHIYDEDPWRNSRLRSFAVKNYLVFYLPDERSHTVYVVRIFYGGRDVKQQLNGSTNL